MNSNLPKFIALERVVQSLQHGALDLKLQIRSGSIIGVTTTGSKRTLYNSSEKDINTNEVAVEYILKRMKQQLQSGVAGELTFRIVNQGEKIRSIEVESTQTIK